jgi:hypothetical protein
MPGLFQKVDTGLKEKGAKKLFGALGAGDGKSERAVIRRSVKGESEERAALALGGKEIGDQQEACILARGGGRGSPRGVLLERSRQI